jgi:Right handed beta helix region
MHRTARLLSVLLLGVVTGCQDHQGTLAPSFATSAASPGCPANPTVTVSDDASLRAAIAAAHPGDVIAVSGTIEVTADDTIATDNVTLTCATPGSGLVAAAFGIEDMLLVGAKGVVVTGLVLDGTHADQSPFLALNDGVALLAQDVQFTNNTVTCPPAGTCVFFAGGTGAVVSDNVMQADAALTGIQIQANGPDPTAIPLPIRVDGARIERNTVVATSPSGGGIFGGIRPFDASGVVIADNVVTGPWRRSLSATRLSDSRISDNALQGALLDGIRTSAGGFTSPAGIVARNVFTGNQVSGAGRAGVFAQKACANKFLSNDLRGNVGDLGVLLNDSTGANVVAGVNNAVVIDNGAFDCDGDGRTDPNIITGGGAHHQPAPPDPTGATAAALSHRNPQPL